MTNHENFKATFNQMRLSQTYIEELKNVENKKLGRGIAKYASAIAAAFVIVFLSSNGICYAMTGNSVIEEVVNKYKKLTKEEVRVNNDIPSDQVIDSYLGEDGLYHYEFTDGSSANICIEDPEHTSVFSFKQKIDEGTSYSVIWFVGELKKSEDRLILDIVEPIDITEDFADGVASGTFEYKWKTGDVEYEATFAYKVEGTLENYTFNAWWIEE